MRALQVSSRKIPVHQRQRDLDSMSSTALSTGFLDRTLGNIRRAWRGLSTSLWRGQLAPDLPDEDRDTLRAQMLECLEGRGGEVSARARAAALGTAYLDLNDIGKLRFLTLMATDFGVRHDAVVAKAEQLAATPDVEQALHVEAELRDLLRPQWGVLLTQFNSLPSGVKFLVDMRADLLRIMDDDVRLRALDKDMRRLLMSWFDIGFLEIRRITWDAPAALLERLIEYEAVHEIRSWSDLKNRLGTDRRCYAFFHPNMPDEPLIFVQVALVSKLSDNVQVLLDVDAPVIDESHANTAIFYSITNTQAGLKGVSLGDFLIKRVVNHLMRDLPGVKTFSTLSPVPGFMRYLDSHDTTTLLTTAEQDALESVVPEAQFVDLVKDAQWAENDALCDALKGPLLRLCAKYLVEEKRNGHSFDPVANFHLNNGAHLERINWLADRSAKGMRESAGMMVNYLYQLKHIEANHEAYRETGTTKISSAVQALLK